VPSVGAVLHLHGLEHQQGLAGEQRRLRDQHDRDMKVLHDEISKVRDERREAIKRVEEQIALLRDELRRTAEAIESRL